VRHPGPGQASLHDGNVSLNDLHPVFPRRTRRPLGLAVLAVAAALTFAGCATEEPQPTPGASGPSERPSTASPSPSGEPDDDGEPATPPTAPEEATPIGVSCEQLLTADDIYAYNPNLALVAGSSHGAAGNRAVAAEGIACHYQNLTSGETIIVSAANPGPTMLAQVRSELSGSAASADGLGGEGWYGGGTATVIAGPYLVTAASDIFTAAADAQQLTTTAISRLP
jgi:hypothetical protein